ncbi:MAG: hypothetical protein Q9175_004885 [Cornicularia normoerica]
MSGSKEDKIKEHDNKDVEYNLPRNDAAEHVRLNDQAAGYIDLMKGKIIHATLESPTKILDVGCDTGIITRHLGSIYPTASVYGIVISPVPPTTASDSIPSTPPNVGYIIGDIRKLAGEDERLKAGNFDCIFQRGWLEIHDYVEIWYNVKEGDRVVSRNWKWLKAMRRGADELGLDLDIGLHAESYMRKAGLVDVNVEKYIVPIGTWMADERSETRRIGVHQDQDLGGVFSGSILPGITRKLGLGEAEMEELKDECRRCLKEEKGKYLWFYVTVGRKE